MRGQNQSLGPHPGIVTQFQCCKVRVVRRYDKTIYIKGSASNAGKELLNDALLLHEAGFTPEQCVVNVMGVAVSNSYSSPNPEALASQEAASPALLLAKEV